MTEWIISGNPQKFDLINAFQDLGKIDWRQSANIQKGDIVYIYVSEGYQSIKYKCKVNKVDLDHIEIDDSKYYLTNELDRTNKYMELEPIEVFNTFLFSKSYLDKHSFNPPQGPVRVSNNVLQYLNIVQDLLHSNEMDPDKHDGSYELIRETILSYKNMGNLALVDDKDLNLLYHMVIGSWRHGFDKKKESIFKSHLLEKEKQRLIQILDFVLEKAKNGLYTNKEGDEVSVGMFGTGFYTFKTNKKDVSNFIELCINIIDEQDDNRIYDISDSVLKNGIMGMKSASASVILHCLKPFVFPIFNSNAGNRDIFEYLGIEIEKRESLEYYIANCRKVKEFRDKNFKFKNYRILDMEARNLGSPDNEKTEQNNSWNKNNNGKRYWLYSPGNDAEDWEEQYNNGIIAIGKDAIGDLKVFKSKEEMRKKMQEIIAPQKNPTQSANTSWQFIHVMKPGDIVFAKKGRRTIIGRGIVSGDYKFDSNRIHHKNIRNIQWTHKKTCNFSEELFAMKTLTNITNDSELIKKIENSFNNNEDNEVKNNNTKIITNYLNTILYGPPGTGKTYNTVIKAIEIIDKYCIEYDDDGNVINYDEVKEEFDKAKKEGKIEFITFHQSYAYEEFIEGIKPVVSNDFECENDEINNNGEIKYKIDEGVFKRICNKAITAKLKKDNSIKDLIRSDASVWKVTIRDVVKQDCFGNNRVRIDYDFETKEAKKFNELIDKGDIILSTNGSRSKINGIAIVNNDEAIKLDSSEDQTSRDVIWLVKDIDENITELNDNKLLSRNTFSRVPSMKASNILKLTLDLNGKKENKSNDKSEPYVLIIDEINRGNISKIFGELITLIEEDKRESFSVRLPYSHEEFTVPKNLYIIGTMNTSDRSIASIDIALRRRFTFKEMMPDDSKIDDNNNIKISENLYLKTVFNTLNKRIKLLLDRDHQIGHSYFMNIGSIENLKSVWFNCVMPLLNEYFYNDWEKLRALLGEAKDPVENKDNNDKNKKIWPSFIKKTEETTFAIEYEIDKDEQFDFVSDTEIDFEKALENAFTKKTS